MTLAFPVIPKLLLIDILFAARLPIILALLAVNPLASSLELPMVIELVVINTLPTVTFPVASRVPLI